MDFFDKYMSKAMGELTEATSYPDVMAVGRPSLMEKYNKNKDKELGKELYINPTPDVLHDLAYRVYKGTREHDDRYEGTQHANEDVIVEGDVRGIVFKNKLYCMNANYDYAHWDILDKMIEKGVLTDKDFQTIGIKSVNQFKTMRTLHIQNTMEGYTPFIELFICVRQEGTSNTFAMGESYKRSTYNSEELKTIIEMIHIEPYEFVAYRW